MNRQSLHLISSHAIRPIHPLFSKIVLFHIPIEARHCRDLVEEVPRAVEVGAVEICKVAVLEHFGVKQEGISGTIQRAVGHGLELGIHHGTVRDDASVQRVDNVFARLAVATFRVDTDGLFHFGTVGNHAFFKEILWNVKQASISAEIQGEALLAAFWHIDKAGHQVCHVPFLGTLLRDTKFHGHVDGGSISAECMRRRAMGSCAEAVM